MLRPWDNYYWFIEFHKLPEKHVMRPAKWPADGRGFNSLDLGAKLTYTDKLNSFKKLTPKRQGQGMTFWLSPDFVDFSKTFEFDVAGGVKESIKPSRETLLEDVRRRGDRKRPFWAKKYIPFRR